MFPNLFSSQDVPARPTNRPQLETLEDRTVPSTVAMNAADGVYRWDSAAGLARISTGQASQLDVDDNGNVYGKFSDGLWRWNRTAGWARLSTLNADSFQTTSGGVLYGDFGAQGVWRWSGGAWSRISALNVTSMAVSDSDAFFGRFDTGGVGVWRFTTAQGLQLLSSNRPDSLGTDDAGNFVGNYNTLISAGDQGTWRWNRTTGWSRLSNVVATIDVSDNGTVFENRQTAGVWRAVPGGPGVAFARVGTVAGSISNRLAIQAMPDGSVFVHVSSVLTNNGLNSGYYYNGATGAQTTVYSGGVFTRAYYVPGAVGRDGDIFLFNRASQATRWAPGTGLTGLGVSNVNVMASQS